MTEKVDVVGDESLMQTEEEFQDTDDIRLVPKTQSGRTGCFQKWPPRHVVVTCAACFIVEFTLGIAYTSGDLLPYLTSYIRNRTDGSVGYARTMWVDTGRIMATSGLMPLFGLIERFFHPRVYQLMGMVFFSGSFFATSWSVQKSFPWTVFCMGVLQGCGQTVLYPACLNVALKWLPQRKGLVGGIVIGGFGGGAFLWDQVVTNWINPHNLQADLHTEGDAYFTQAEVLNKVPTCFLLLGGLMAGTQLLCLLSMSFSPDTVSGDSNCKTDSKTITVSTDPQSSREPFDEPVMNLPQFERELEENNIQRNGEPPPPLSPSLPSTADDTDIHNFTIREIFRSRTMWTIVVVYLFTSFSTDILTEFYKVYGQTFVKNDRLLSIMASCSSVVNAVGRPFWGLCADQIGFHPCLVISLGILGFFSATFMMCQYGGGTMLFLWVLLIFLGVSGVYAIAGPLIFALFGSRTFTFNVGFLSFAGVFEALIDVYVVKEMKPFFGWSGIFLTASSFAFTGMLISISLLCSCGHPLSPQMKRPLFKPKQKQKPKSSPMKNLAAQE